MEPRRHFSGEIPDAFDLMIRSHPEVASHPEAEAATTKIPAKITSFSPAWLTRHKEKFEVVLSAKG
jgi:hypothetical protein